jgi:FkbM family methyltransferase
VSRRFVSLLDRILNVDELREAPPVLVDVGASGRVHPKWRRIAKHSVCVAFEPDERELSQTTGSGSFKALHVFNRAVSEDVQGKTRFHLTASPFCSSRLAPDRAGVRPYAFARLFEVERVVELETIDLATALDRLELNRVDWFKCDSQGTDLRLLRSLGEERLSQLLVAELEPGIIDAYEGEDKLSDVMRFMVTMNFWMSDLSVQGSQRIDAELAAGELTPVERRFLRVATKQAPGWGEVEYFNDFTDESLGKREFLLGYVFAVIRGHDAFALELAVRGKHRFRDARFDELKRAARRRIRLRLAKLPYSAATEVLRARFG